MLMEPQTDTAGSQDWLEASRELKIRAYVQNSAPTRTVYNTLSRLAARVQAERRCPIDPELDLEFQAWDALSDEALSSFEHALT
jgi:hypothetical protein